MNKWLSTIRNEQELTQVQVADRAGISERYYQDIEAGRIPPVSTAKRIAKVLGFEWEQFYSTDDKDTA